MKATLTATGGPQPGTRMVKEITGRHVLVLMLAFFGVIIATDAYLVYKAVSTFGGIETKDAYRKGVSYNERIANERTQEALGWTKEVRLEKDELRIAVRDKDHKGVEGLQISALFGRPATNTEDRTLALTQIGSGEYMATVGDIAPGNWVAALEAREPLSGSGAIVYQSKVRLWKAP